MSQHLSTLPTQISWMSLIKLKSNSWQYQVKEQEQANNKTRKRINLPHKLIAKMKQKRNNKNKLQLL